jgi:hypothetical protein
LPGVKWLVHEADSLHPLDIHKSVHLQYLPKMRPTRRYASQFIYFNNTLCMFQAVPLPIIRSSNSTYSFWYLSNLAANCCYHGWDGTGLDTYWKCIHFQQQQQIAARFDEYQKLYVQFELLMMG